jgi:diguanylate cyclase (GGDEF)-like protein
MDARTDEPVAARVPTVPRPVVAPGTALAIVLREVVESVNPEMADLLGAAPLHVASFPQAVSLAVCEGEARHVFTDGRRWSVQPVGERWLVLAASLAVVDDGDQAVPVPQDERLDAIVQLHRDLAHADFDGEEIVQWLVERSASLFGSREAGLGLVDGDEVVYTNVTRKDRGHVETRTPLSRSMAGLCIRSGSTMVSDDTEVDGRADLAACRSEGARSMVLVPLRHRGQVVGVLNVHSTRPHAFSPFDVETVEQVGGVVSAAYGHAADLAAKRQLVGELAGTLSALQANQVQLLHDALHDPLTGLANRVLFLDRLRQALAASARSGSTVAVMFLDVDRFKQINDRHGHDAGDTLLVEVARRMTASLRTADTAARFGGDEFTALCVGVEGAEGALVVARRFAGALRTGVGLPDGVRVIPTVSIGVACSTGGLGSAEELVKQADLALYRAKAGGRDGIEVYVASSGDMPPLEVTEGSAT